MILVLKIIFLSILCEKYGYTKGLLDSGRSVSCGTLLSVELGGEGWGGVGVKLQNKVLFCSLGPLDIECILIYFH